MNHPKRFSCIAAPSGLWMVWDSALNTPAMLDGCALDGLAEDRAEAARNMLDCIYRNQLDAPSMRASRILELFPEIDYAKLPRTEAAAGVNR